MRGYDFIVIGVGGMGSAALDHLARRGHRVLGLERFAVGHDRGSSHGGTRIIRKAYFEHPDYVPLLQRAYDLWDALAADSRAELLVRCGLLLAGRPEGPVIVGARLAAARHGVAVEDVAAAELPRRFPGFALDGDMVALLEPEGGFLRVEACVRAHAARAVASGATIREGEIVRAVDAGPGGVTVETDRGSYAAGGVVLCGGAYGGPLLAHRRDASPSGRKEGSLDELALPLQVRWKVMLWYDADAPVYRRDRGCPVFAFGTDAGFFYGFPVEDAGLKVAEHSGGEDIAGPAALAGAGESESEIELDRSLRPGDEAPVRRFLARHLPAAALAPRKHHAACMYTMTPDEHFIIDRHPDLPDLDGRPSVVFAAGFSGHGFKFASVVGEALADLATAGRTDLPIGFLGAGRFLGRRRRAGGD